MVFAGMEYLWLLAATPVLGLFLVLSFRARRKALERFAGRELGRKLTEDVSGSKRRWKAILVVLAFAFIVLALARPQSGGRMRIVEVRGTDIMFCLDTSYSMLAEDIKPNRLARAKREITNIVSKLGGDRVGLIVFAGEAFVQCPLTTDYAALLMLLDEIGTDAVPEPGTSLGKAVDLAARALEKVGSESKIVVCFTDGEDFLTDPLASAEKAAKQGVKIYTVAVGGIQGVPIPMRDSAGRLSYKKDKSGRTVFTRANTDLLSRMASKTGGEYFELSYDGADLSSLGEGLLELKRRRLGESRMLVRDERFQYPLAIALGLLVAEASLSDRLSRKRKWLGRFM